MKNPKQVFAKNGSVFYAPFKKDNGWWFLMPAEHGPPMHKKSMGDILVGPFNNRAYAHDLAKKTKEKCEGASNG